MHRPRFKAQVFSVFLILAVTVAALAQQPGDSGTHPADPERFRFLLSDGSKVTGRLSLSHIELATEFGRLQIPITKLIQVVPGLEQRSEEREEIEQLVAMLGKGEKESAQARDELIQMGVKVREFLRQQREEASEKLQVEIDKVLTRLDELAPDEAASDDSLLLEDRVRMAKFTVVGKILSQKFQIQTQFGDLTVTMADVVRLERIGVGGLPDAHKSLDVDGTNLAQLKFKDSGIEIRPGDKIVVRATGSLSRSRSKASASSPDGSPQFGMYSQDPPIQGGALVAKIGPSGKIVRVGSHSTFVAKQSGVLQFAIGMRPEYVGRFQFTGKYTVTVKVLRGGK